MFFTPLYKTDARINYIDYQLIDNTQYIHGQDDLADLILPNFNPAGKYNTKMR